MLQNASAIARYEPTRSRSATMCTGSSGARTLDSMTPNIISRSALATNMTIVSGALQLSVSAFDNP